MSEKKTPISRRSFVKAALATLGIGIPTSAVAASGKASKPLAPLDTPDGDEVVYLEATAASDNVPLHLKQLDTTNNPAALRITNIGSGLDIHSMNAGAIGAGAFAFMAKNGAGSTVDPGDVGYIGFDGTFKKITTEFSVEGWCVAVTGGADGADIFAARRGRVPVKYTGSAPATGDYLVTSSTSGMAQAQTVMRPEVFAVCQAPGSGGVVDALLLTQRAEYPIAPEPDVLRLNNHSGTLFSASIASVSGTDVVYTSVTGNEDSIKPFVGNELGKVVLHNTSDGTEALIQNVDLGTNTITLTDNAPAGWGNGDAITTNSQTNTDLVIPTSSERYFDVELVTADIPDNAVTIKGELTFRESAPAIRILLHPYLPGEAARRKGIDTIITGVQILRRFYDMPIVDRRFTVGCLASGVGTCTAVCRVSVMVLAVP